MRVGSSDGRLVFATALLRKLLAGLDVRAPDTRRTWRGPSDPCRRPSQAGNRRSARSRAAAASPAGPALQRRVDFRSACVWPVAAAVAVGELVERRHAAVPGRPHLIVMISPSRVESRFRADSRRRASGCPSCGRRRPAVARLAVALLLVQPHAGGDVGGIGDLCPGGRRGRQGHSHEQYRAQQRSLSALVGQLAPLHDALGLILTGRFADRKPWRWESRRVPCSS